MNQDCHSCEAWQPPCGAQQHVTVAAGGGADCEPHLHQSGPSRPRQPDPAVVAWQRWHPLHLQQHPAHRLQREQVPPMMLLPG
jgi:hypothetical protein